MKNKVGIRFTFVVFAISLLVSSSAWAGPFDEPGTSSGIRLQRPEFLQQDEIGLSPFDQEINSLGVELVGYMGDESPEEAEPTADEFEHVIAASHAEPDYYRDYASMQCARPYCKQFLPEGLLYKSYLAGPKESRMSSAWLNESGRGWIWDVTLGGRVGLYRNGTKGPINPEGFQVDIEGSAQVRLDLEQSQDVDATDYRFGIPFTWKKGRNAYKVGYYHISSHLGDEWMVRHNSFDRINYVRESFVAGMTHQCTDDVLVYGEIGYSVLTSGGAKPLELQFGAEYSPVFCTGKKSAPFAAINGLSREDFDFGVSLNIVAGWQWRSGSNERLMRYGLQYYNGESLQYSFFDKHEELLGMALWFDY